MSTRVLVIPEDFVHDQYILKPILEVLVCNAGIKPKLQVCQAPRLCGVSEALKWDRLKSILDMYRMCDLFLLVVDRDANEGRAERLANLEELSRAHLAEHGRGAKFLAAQGWQEIEVWVLAGMSDLPKEWAWTAVRAHRDPKEAYFRPYAEMRGVEMGPSGGRKALGVEAGRQYRRIRSRCDEVRELESRVAAL